MSSKSAESKYALRKLSSFRASNPSYLAYIPILDKNPKKSAGYLTRKDLIDSYDLIKETFSEIKSKNIKHKLLADTILRNYNNFLWYCTFLKSVEKILKKTTKFDIPYELCPEKVPIANPRFAEGRPNSLKFQQPFAIYYDEKKKYFVEELGSNRFNDAVDNYRLKYILERHDLEEFLNASFPHWYTFCDTTIYEKYCSKTNKRIRIDLVDEKLRYFIAGASDNWKEIENVPSSMEYVIYAMLYRTFDVELDPEGKLRKID